MWQLKIHSRLTRLKQTAQVIYITKYISEFNYNKPFSVNRKTNFPSSHANALKFQAIEQIVPPGEPIHPFRAYVTNETSSFPLTEGT